MSAKPYLVLISTRVPSGWSEWRLHDRAKTKDEAEILLDKYQHHRGYPAERFQFTIKNKREE